MKNEEKTVLVLNRYQRDNLLWLLNIIWNGGVPDAGLNTGDWVGEIPFLLAPESGGRLTPEHRPNISLEDWEKSHK